MRMSFLEAAVSAGLAIGLVACGGGGNQAAMQNAGGAAEPAAQPSAPSAMASGGGAGKQVRLIPKNESGVNGAVTLTPQGDSLVVAVNVNGLPDGAGAYPSHIHQGTCASPGQVVQPLNDVQADSAGDGHASTTVAMSVLKQGQSHLVMVHRKDGSLASCADLPADLGSGGM
ncbi:MAG TPA: CHRD domain-containing protein [Longimicrobiales bacterium]|nr:CHRD domain-containing protein [Longimicrobiales bacterium]